MDITTAVDVLTTLGVLPVILLAATVGIAAVLYNRFKRA